jgi:NAD(P)H-hydrate repair Nnr-like enzyme with NAD(P)H-hydrate epimerase domain
VFLGGAVALAACGGSTVDQPDEVTLIHKDLGLYNLPQAKSVDCPSGVDAKVGTTFVCHATLPNGQVVTLPSRVNTVNGSNATLGPDPSVLQQALAISAIYKSLQSPPKSVDCPSDVQPKAGTTFDCKVTGTNGKTLTFTLKVTSASSTSQNVQVIHVQSG